MNAIQISKLLKQSGYTKTESRKTRVKGWRDVTAGYLVKQYSDFAKVTYETSSSNVREGVDVTPYLRGMAQSLTIAGLLVSVDEFAIYVSTK
jgi:hypothetical protein